MYKKHQVQPSAYCSMKGAQIWKIMKLIVFFIVLGTVCVFGASHAQKISLDLKGATLEHALKQIGKQSGHHILYNPLMMQKSKPISLHVKNVSVEEVLELSFTNQPLDYTINKKTIVVKEKPAEVLIADKLETADAKVLQQQRVEGTVSDDNGGLAGVSVVVKGTSEGTKTDDNGRYTLQVSGNNAVLVFSMIGYEPQEVAVSQRSQIDVKMTPLASDLEEVVIVGFGTQKKINLTGAVGTVSGEELAERPVTNVTQALQGIMPGLNITQGSGSLESTPSMNIRGTATIGQGTSGAPLVLVDGVETDLNAINPQDVENISVLKDAASSSIYGSRAPFGVILVTTKSGSKDGSTSINYNNNVRVGMPINMMQMMNSVGFASWTNDAVTNAGQGVFFEKERFDNILAWFHAKPHAPGQRITEDGEIIYAIDANDDGQWLGGFSAGADDVDWYDVMYKDRVFSQEHNINARGGTDKFNYYLSGGFMGQNGLIDLGDEGLKRYTATAKLNTELTSWMSLNYNMRFARSNYHRPSALTDNMYSNMAPKSWPVLPMYDRNGYIRYNDNTALMALLEGGSDYKETDKTFHQLGFVIEPIKNWVTNVEFNYRINAANRHWDTQYLYSHDINGTPYLRTTNSHVHEDLLKENYYNFNARTAYSFSLDQDHNVHLMSGFQVENLKQKAFGLQRDGIMIPSKPEVDLTSGLDVNGNPLVPSVNGGRNEWSTVGFFGRVNYDYKDKYLFEANARLDGSSRFRTGNQWKLFPSFSAGWNIAFEDFFELLREQINVLKLRASYGSLGNQNTDNWYYTYQTLSASSAAGGWLQGGARPNVATAPGLVSETLTWETIASYNLGVDFSAFNNRLDGAFDWYVRDTRNMVGNAPALPAILGTAVPQTNNTDLQTNGWELSVGWKDRLENDLFYGIRLSLSDARTKITRYPNNPTGAINTYIEGRYINEIWGYETMGLAKTGEEMSSHLEALPNGGQDALGSDWRAGDIMYKDLNGDGRISGGNGTLADPGDRKVIGNSTPRYMMGLTLNSAYKDFDVRVFLQGVLKRDYWQGSDYFFGATNSGIWGSAGITHVEDYFRNEDTWSVQQGHKEVNTDSYLPRALFSGKNIQPQTRYLQNAAYLRVKNIQVGYTLPRQLTTNWSMSTARIFLSGENLWTITGLVDQFDPETVGTVRGNAYPLSRTLSAGISVTF